MFLIYVPGLNVALLLMLNEKQQSNACNTQHPSVETICALIYVDTSNAVIDACSRLRDVN